MNPQVTTIIPCRDAEEFVGEAVDSALAQLPRGEVQVVVVDDASRDRSVDVAAGRPDAEVVRLPAAGGAARARNIGVGRARAPYLHFLDSDDVVAPGTYAALIAALERDPSAGAAIAPWAYLRRDTGGWAEAPADRSLPDPAGDPLGDWLAGNWVPCNAILWRRGPYQANGGWDERLTLNDDGDLMLRALAGGLRITIAESGRALYRRHGSSRLSLSSNHLSAERILSGVRVLEKLATTLEAQGRFDAYASRFGLRYHDLAIYAYRIGDVDLGRLCLTRSRDAAGDIVTGRTRTGRALTRLFGLEGKERVARALGRWGLGGHEQRRQHELRRLDLTPLPGRRCR